MYNEAVINTLPDVEKVDNIYANLSDEGGNTLYTFLFNPQEKSFSRSSTYSEAATSLTAVPYQQYKYTSGLKLSLPNLILESYNRGKSLEDLITSLQSLMVVTAPNTYPPKLYFNWGTYSFGPCVLTNLNWTETSWLNGKVADIRLSIDLLEIPKPKLLKEPPKPADLSNTTLTSRQQDDGREAAKKWLSENVSKLTPTVSELVRTKSYKLSLNPSTNEIKIFSPANKELGLIGVYDGKQLNTTKSTILK